MYGLIIKNGTRFMITMAIFLFLSLFLSGILSILAEAI